MTPFPRRVATVTLDLDERGGLAVYFPPGAAGMKLADVNRVKALAGTRLDEWHRLRVDWCWLQQMARQGKLILDGPVRTKVGEALAGAAQQAVPLYPLPPEQTIAWIVDNPVLRAKRSDFNLGLIGGRDYPVEVESFLVKETRVEPTIAKTNTGTVKLREVQRRGLRLLLRVQGGAPKPFEWLEGHDDPAVLFDLFEVPPVPSYAEVEPTRLARALAAVEAVEQKYAFPRGWQLVDWQRDDLIRAVAWGRMLYAHEQGLGKTVQGLTFTLALHVLGAPDLALFIVPQDLIPQWQREARKRFGREMRRVDGAAAVEQAIADRRAGKTFQEPPLTCRELRDLIRSGRANGWYITHYEAISRSGRKEERDDKTQERVLYRKSGYSALTTAFKRATVVVDEGAKLQGETTNISYAVRGMRARYRLVLTGTPVRNYLKNIFWLLWWGIGNRTARFPFSYQEGQKAFVRDFGTTEKVETETTWKAVPDPANLLMLRRVLAPCVIRRRMNDVHLPVACRFSTVPVPWGRKQRKQYANWLDPERFAKYWKAKFPTTNLAGAQVLRMGAVLGQFSHLEYATTCPEAEVERFNDPPNGCSNWTPKLLRSLEIIRSHVRNGDRVLFGSALVATVSWMAAQLRTAGIRVECLTEERQGKAVSLGPAERAAAVERFLGAGGQVLVAGMNALALGHNLEAISTVVVAGLPWDLLVLEQFLARVRRYSSKKDITVYVVMTEGSLDEKKWDLLERKRRAAGLILDVVDLVRDEAPVSLDEVLAELVARGIASGGPDVDEASCEQAWKDHQPLGSTALTSDVRPPPSDRFRATMDLAAALSSGYRVPFWTGHQAGIDPQTRQFALIDRQKRLLARGNAFDVAEVAVLQLGVWKVTKACRLARMPAEERVAALSWWKYVTWEGEILPADATWWRHGVWLAEIEPAERLRAEIMHHAELMEAAL